MSAFLTLVHLDALMAKTRGNPNLVIGMIDGAVDTMHPDLQAATLRSLSAGSGECAVPDSVACVHGTFIAGVLCGQRGSPAPALCPDCQVLLRPIFCEDSADQAQCPLATPTELAAAIRQVVVAGAHLINLSVSSTMAPFETSPALQSALDLAQRRGVLVVAAVGNQALLGPLPLFQHRWVIPVVACDVTGRIASNSNLGPMVGKQGLIAPGVGVTSTTAYGDYTSLSGSSMAVPFVVGTLALLWSLFPQVSAAALRRAILLPGHARTSIIPPRLDATASWRVLQQFI